MDSNRTMDTAPLKILKRMRHASAREKRHMIASFE
jgi:hypothetical protein